MGGFFGAVSKRDCVMDIFFGVDYHSHLGTKSGGMIVYDAQDGFQRQIHSSATHRSVPSLRRIWSTSTDAAVSDVSATAIPNRFSFAPISVFTVSPR